MVIAEKNFKKIITQSGLVSIDDLNSASKVAEHLECSLTDVLLGRDLLKEEDLGKILSKFYQIEFIDLNKQEIDIKALQSIPEDFAQEAGVVAFKKKDNTLFVAMEDPHDLELIEHIKKITKDINKITTFVSTSGIIKNALKLYKTSIAEVEQIETKTSDLSVITTLEKILEEAIREGASDIHIEPLEDRLLIRYRVDGVLHDEKVYEKSFHPSVVARIKILSDLKLDETRLPQDGQFSIITKGHDKVSFRVSVIPSVNGEKVVLRILESSLTRFNLEELGLLPEDQEIASKVLERTHGMLLVTGPTGSGKTTTLYTVLGLLNKSNVNIVTIEDPVENKIKRINQIQVNTQINLAFATGLRSVLRQDPDIIMVGEIRDKETAIIATNAAMTGHLVFSTVHANTSAGAIPRMIDLGAEPFLISSTLNMVIAQRLVRVLCSKCKIKGNLNPLTKNKLKTAKKSISPEILKILKNIYQPVGCNACHQTGFSGRIGIFEILNIDNNIKEMIVSKKTSDQIWRVAREKGAKTMLEDGIIKVAKGITTIEEVFRVISE
ncbi:hypothetical protein A2159_01195 [Candidatus Woesebacteria bacterium RBG_13_34_9]|uniref:Bacterial type II secretion system protein E domain-containing protein n=1 Tax=Candidatus Woesebacteria bacterium RBG_13_34_9 TaxID=1802477 RepID=A0A1F7X1N4_9BACT|nr:MAG: hypothetical protein A2159_01195 [Candidatus Woesebacteria bacterium RBG_13_34_9]